MKVRGRIGLYLLLKSRFWVILLLGALLFGIRWTKGAGYLDLYSILLNPILPGTAQREWIKEGENIERNIRLKLLEADNSRLRRALSLQEFNIDQRISGAVISRSSSNWWQQLEINKGKKDGVLKGQAVIGPGGLIGLVDLLLSLSNLLVFLVEQRFECIVCAVCGGGGGCDIFVECVVEGCWCAIEAVGLVVRSEVEAKRG